MVDTTENITFPQLRSRTVIKPTIVTHGPNLLQSSKTGRIYLVSTYVARERLSVMHDLAGVVENLVQNSESAPLSEQTLPSPLKILRVPHSQNRPPSPPPPKIEI